MAAKAYLEQYLECMDSMPLDLQRVVSQLWELDRQTQELLPHLQRAREQCKLFEKQSSVSLEEQQQWSAQLYRLMVTARHVGNEKLQLTSEMMDIVSDYKHQLALREKDVDNSRTREEPASVRVSSNIGSHGHHKNCSSPLANSDAAERRKIDRVHKRSRISGGLVVGPSGSATHHDRDESPPPSPLPPAKESTVSRGKDVSAPNINSAANNSSSRPSKKKAKLKKSRSNSKDSSTTIYPQPGHIPTPDFSTEPIDPDEPTYCLCQQVSFGEMIGCDNDDCQIEWFHFQCVGLTSKPKGKWYCPQCTNERSKYKTIK